MSGIGHISIPRLYYACRHYGAKHTPWETWAGIIGSHRITPHARRMIVLAGSGCSFEEAARNLVELSHVQVANDLVRAVCDAKGKAVRQWMNQSPEPKKVFDQAQGVVAFSTDGLKINTVDGWREIRQSAISKRMPGLSVPADQWDDRVLDPPAARVAVCAIAHCDEHLNSTGPPDPSPATAEAWGKLLGYLNDNRDSLWYGQRLEQGLIGGSG